MGMQEMLVWVVLPEQHKPLKVEVEWQYIPLAYPVIQPRQEIEVIGLVTTGSETELATKSIAVIAHRFISIIIQKF